MATYSTEEELSKATQKNIRQSLQYAKHKEFVVPKPIDESKYYVILVNGKRIETRSSKKCWKSLRGARTALSAYLSQVCSHERRQYWIGIRTSGFSASWSESRRIFKEVFDEWAEKHVKIISLKEYNDMIKKRSKK